jgi:hypothetical protein
VTDERPPQLIDIARRLDVARHSVDGEPFQAHYWRHAYATDVDRLVAIIEVLMSQVRAYATAEHERGHANGSTT